MLEELLRKLQKEKTLTLKVKITPRANRSEIKSLLTDGTIKINIAAPPQKGKANKELISLLSQEFSVPQGNIQIISGQTNKFKLVKITK